MGEEVVGRSEEQALLASFFEQPSALPGAVILAGGAGLGKTTLWRAGVAAARERSYRILTSAPAEPETRIAFSSLRDLFGGVPPAALSDLPAPQRRALEVALLLEDADESSTTERGAIAAAVLAVLQKLAQEGPVLVAVDDAQWLDTPSARALAFALRRLQDEQVGVLISYRSGDVPLGLDRAPIGERGHRLDLGPLSSGALHQLLHARLGVSLSRPLLGRVREVTGGNPLYALEIGRAIHARGREVEPGEELPLPQTLTEAVRGRLAGLPHPTRETLVALAALSQASAPEVQAATDVEDAWGALQPALENGVVELAGERFSFTHPMLASVVLTDADPRVRRELHRRIALTLTDPEARARHTALAAELPDGEAAALLEDAAQRARARGAAAAAAELLELARGFTPPEDEDAWARLTLAAAAAHAESAAEGRAQELVREVIQRAQPGPARARASGLLGYWLSDIDLCTSALSEVGDDVRLRGWLEYIRAYSHYMRGEFLQGLERAREAVATASHAGDEETRVRALTILSDLEGITCTGDPLRGLREAADVEADGVPILASPETYLGRWYVRRDELEAGREVLEPQRARAFDEGDDEAAHVILFLLFELEWLAGDWKRAGVYSHEYVEGYRLDTENVLGREVAHWAEGLSAACNGRLEHARELAEAGARVAQSAGRKAWVLRNEALLGFIELSRGDHAAACRHLCPLPQRLAKMGVADPGIHLVLGDAIEALIGAGDLERAEAEIAALRERGRALDRPWALSVAGRCRGLLLGAEGDLDGAIAALEQALVEHDRLSMPFERGRTLLALGQVQRRLKQRKAARRTLDDARAVFEELGAVLWAEKAREALERIGGRTSGTGELTVTERRVAEQVAAGSSNKEAAAALFVTVKTVEANLSRVYAKLGIRSRSELATSLAERLAAPKL